MTENKKSEHPPIAYVMTALCVGDCQQRIMGPSRWATDPEWTSAQVEEFEALVRAEGWTQNEEQKGTGMWQCSGECKSPFDFDLKEFTIPKDAAMHVKPIRPDFFGQVMIHVPRRSADNNINKEAT
jgi:hypothetical protein